MVTKRVTTRRIYLDVDVIRYYATFWLQKWQPG